MQTIFLVIDNAPALLISEGIIFVLYYLIRRQLRSS